MKRYIHPQGATAIVYDDGTLAAFDKNGKVKKTSATAEKLARGHGGWVLTEGEVDHVNLAKVLEKPDLPNGGPIFIPMKFQNGRIEDLPRYVNDPQYVMQQKIDGIRAQIVFEKGRKGCWVRSNSGTRLKSTAAAPMVFSIERRFENYQPTSNYTVDGEIISGVFWAFDFITETEFSLMKRLSLLERWMDKPPMEVKMLPTATTVWAKQELVDRVIQNNGEGFIVKQRESGYTWAGRVEHSLKVKLVDTADCIVTSVHPKKDSISLGVLSAGQIVSVGSTSTIGKGVFKEGDVVEVQYLYAGANGKLVQPTILRPRTDKFPDECKIGQLKHVNKEVVV